MSSVTMQDLSKLQAAVQKRDELNHQINIMLNNMAQGRANIIKSVPATAISTKPRKTQTPKTGPGTSREIVPSQSKHQTVFLGLDGQQLHTPRDIKSKTWPAQLGDKTDPVSFNLYRLAILASRKNARIVSVKDVAPTLGVTSSQARGLLSAALRHGYAKKAGENTYQITLQALPVTQK